MNYPTEKYAFKYRPASPSIFPGEIQEDLNIISSLSVIQLTTWNI
jgi:hypothetical protein